MYQQMTFQDIDRFVGLPFEREEYRQWFLNTLTFAVTGTRYTPVAVALLRETFKYDYLTKRVGVTADKAGNTDFADIDAHAVIKIPKRSHASTVGSGFDRPEGVALDSIRNFYVIDYGTRTLYVVNAAGYTSTVASGCVHPQSVAVDQAGDMFVADSGHNQVIELTTPSQ
jgi:DNA-binding beta-propeller fold protein YncE